MEIFLAVVGGFLALVILLFLVLLVFKGFMIIPQAETRVVERLGKYNRTLGSGVNIVIPWLESTRKIYWRFVATDVDKTPLIKVRETDKIDLRETVYDFPSQHVITKDNVMIEINALIYYQVIDPVRVVYQIANLPDAIEKLTQTTLRNVIGEMDLDETLVSRDTINGRLRIILDEATEKWGIKVSRVELQDITPPPDIRQAMEMQMRAERERRAKILQAEGQKASDILIAEGTRQSAVNEAEGRKQAAVLKAEGEATARKLVAEAEAEALARVSEAVARAQGDTANYLIAVRYIEALKEMVSGKDNKVVYLPYEATSILSSLGGIRELLAPGEKKG